MGLDLNKVVCHDCGEKFLTDEQKKDEGSIVTFYKDKCCQCKDVKLVTSIRHYNYLKKKME